ncbi:hypothetical protein ACQP2X_16090 [Actinoplanes sp. CA-131856]
MKTRSIDPELSVASASEWREADAYRQASAIAANFPGVNISWDQGDEDWIQIIGEEVLGYVHTKRPLVMLLAEFSDQAQVTVEGQVVVLAVNAWTERYLRADVEILRQAFPGYLLPDALPGRSVDAFSAEELWFATD